MGDTGFVVTDQKRTGRAKRARPFFPVQNETRRIVLVLRECIGKFGTYADLKAELKMRLGKLHLAYSATRIESAIAQLEVQGGPVLKELPKPRQLVEKPPEPELFTREDAAVLVKQLYARRMRENREAYARACADAEKREA